MAPDFDGQYGWLVHTLVDMRRQAGVSQGQLAALMSTNQGRISRIESGQLEPSLATFQQYARALGAKLTVEVQPLDADDLMST